MTEPPFRSRCMPPSRPDLGARTVELDAREKQLRDDYDWCLRDADVQRNYRGRVVAVHRRTVWGAGRTHGEAVQDALAKPRCPPREQLAKGDIEAPPESSPVPEGEP